MQNILPSRSEKYSWKNSRPQRINTKAHWNIVYFKCMLYMLTNTNRSTFTSFRITPPKWYLQRSSTPQSRCTLSGYIGVFGCGIEACRPWDPSRKRKARRWRDELREREGRHGVECGVANGYCLKRWRMDHGCVGFSGKMDPFFFSAPLLFSQLLAAKSRGWDGWFLERTCSG